MARPNFDRGAFYRLCREWHGYLSALAFAALAFFAVTGATLNHPEWFAHERAAQETRNVILSAGALNAARHASDQSRALAEALAHVAPLRGVYASGEIVDGEALLHFEGVRGVTTASVDLATGRAEVEIEHATVVSTLNDLHRGKNAGAAWRALIDCVAALVFALSLIGFVLFFSLRFRLLTSLSLTAAGVGLMLAVYYALAS